MNQDSYAVSSSGKLDITENKMDKRRNYPESGQETNMQSE